MAALPYPCFHQREPVDKDNQAAALVAVGRCRIDASCCDNELFAQLVAKNQEQASAVAGDDDSPDVKEEKKKLKKKYMKQGVAMATKLLTENLALDVSIVNVEFVLAAEDIIDTDGCLAACLLDAGCSYICINGNNQQAMDAARIPRERLIAIFSQDLAKKSVCLLYTSPSPRD